MWAWVGCTRSGRVCGERGELRHDSIVVGGGKEEVLYSLGPTV